MKFIINKNVLVAAMQKMLGPTTTKQNLPVLSSVLMSCEENRLKLTTTDLDTTIITFQPVSPENPGVAVVPMKRFFSLIRELPSEDILVEKAKNNLSVRCGKVEFKINTLDPQDFPQIEEEKGASLIRLNPPELEEMIRLTSFCVGYEDVNYVLSGILFEIHENLMRAVSTDGKRLAFAERYLPANQPEVKEKVSFILPIRAVGELQKLIKDRGDEIYMFAG
ncbi:MAG: DNA polymerase III subunit beta [Candidatus Omnitrophica bacterium]|nr:DNA polymerase III subunit beta [Candidatus Omnitrophota bacterium]MBD3268595.1 DNA polymerase III subunit beta [Candidatus Omnitrophota bacterium]